MARRGKLRRAITLAAVAKVAYTTQAEPDQRDELEALPFNSKAVAVEVDDPLWHGKKKLRWRETRNDPLARIAAGGAIKEHELAAGREWQRRWALAGAYGAKGIDTTRMAVFVQGGQLADPFNDERSRALKDLRTAHQAIATKHGINGVIVLRDILEKGLSFRRIAQQFGGSEREISFMFQRAIDTLSLVWGFANRSRFDAKC